MFSLVTDRLVCAAGLAVYNFTSQRRRFQSLLQQSSSSLTTSRFFRLLAVSSIDMFVTVPCVIVLITTQVKTLKPSQKWSDLHYDFGQVFRFSSQDLENPLFREELRAITAVSNWMPLFAAFVYFACFGMHDSALDKYTTSYRAAANVCARMRGYVCSFGLHSFEPELMPRPPCLPFRSRRPSDGPVMHLALGTTVTSPSEMHWVGGRDSRIVVEDEIPHAFADPAGLAAEKVARGHGVLVTTERNVA
jgi:hypothetical protein